MLKEIGKKDYKIKSELHRVSINKDRDCICSDEFIPLENSRITTIKEIFSLRKEYGRVASKIYVDYDGVAYHTGYVFEKRMKYSDCSDSFLMETWVSIEITKKEVFVYVNV